MAVQVDAFSVTERKKKEGFCLEDRSGCGFFQHNERN